MQIEEQTLLMDIKISLSSIHAYDNVNNTIIWKVVMKDLPVLEREIDFLLESK